MSLTEFKPKWRFNESRTFITFWYLNICSFSCKECLYLHYFLNKEWLCLYIVLWFFSTHPFLTVCIVFKHSFQWLKYGMTVLFWCLKRKTCRLVSILLFDWFVYLYFTEQWSSSLSPNPYAVGEANITLKCYLNPSPSNFLNTTFEFRPNKNHDWLTVAYINGSGKLEKLGYHEENFISFLTFFDYSKYSDYYIYFKSIATIHNDRCTVDAELYPSFRCRAFNGSFVTSPEKSILSIKGKIFFL